MTKPKLYYFDSSVSRGDECRLALHLAGVDFEDVRQNREQSIAFQSVAPFGVVPVLELPGKPMLGETNAILGYLGRQHGMHPADPFEAARHEAMMGHVEDLRHKVGPTMRIADPAEKQRAREELARDWLPLWAARAERQIAEDGPFFAGGKLHVVDLKIHLAVRWFANGHVDHVPNTVFDAFPKLVRVHRAVRDEPRVKAWYAGLAK